MVFAAFMAGSGCIKDKEKDFAEDQVSFSANTGALETRTDYGEDGSVGGTSVTYVNWVAGDKIMILSSTGSNDTYTVSEDHDGSDSQGISKGNVNPDNSGIAWGTGEQTFYAMYPANVSGSSLTSSAMTCVVPVTWTPASETELGQLPYGYMFAKETTSRTTSVSLTFNAKFTSFTFTLKNPTASPVTLSSLSLSSASKAMSGTFNVNPSTGAIASLPTPGANKSVTVDFTLLTGDGLVIPAASQATPGTKTFTIVTVPDTFNDLTVTCTNSGGASRTLGLKKAGTYLSFDALKKHNISITLPSFADFEYGLSVIDPTDLTYNGNSSTNGTVTSYKSNDGGTTQTSVPWFVEGYYATEADAEAGTNKLASYSTSGLLSAAIANVTSPTSVTTSVPISYNPAVGKTLGDYIDDNIKNSTFGAKSSPSRYINLANAWNLVSDTESDAIIQSANCYIVNGPGYYRIPLIMGNGQYTSDFVNYKGNSISTDAYLKNQGGTPTKAKVIWEDVDGLINGASSGNDWEIPSAINGDWLCFYIDKDHIKQGNAVIAVYDNAEVVMWSYHIWVTDYVPSNYAASLGVSSGDISYTNSQSKTYTIPRYDLGMVINGNVSRTDFYGGSVLYARLQQGTVSSPVGQYAVMRIHRPEYTGTITDLDRKYGHCTYYQWGRNDPLQGNYSTFGKNSGIKGGSSTTPNSVSNVLKYGINNPNSYNSYAGKYDLNTVWDLYYTPKTGTTTSSRVKDKSISKTIYDPSPVGYHVPPYAGLSGITVIDFGHRNSGSNTGMHTSSTYRWSSLRAYDEYAFSALETGNNSLIRTSGLPIRPVQDPTFDPTNN